MSSRRRRRRSQERKVAKHLPGKRSTIGLITIIVIVALAMGISRALR